MAAQVLRCAGQAPSKPALEILTPDGATILTYQQLERSIRGIATGLLNRGLSAGDRVLLRLDNTPEFPLAYLACIADDLVPVPTAAQLTGHEVEKLCKTVNPSLIIASPGVPLPETAACDVIFAETLVTYHDLPPAEFALGDPNRLAYIIFTSGTSGVQRAV